MAFKMNKFKIILILLLISALIILFMFGSDIFNIIRDKLMIYDYISYNGNDYYISIDQSLSGLYSGYEITGIKMVCNNGYVLKNSYDTATVFVTDKNLDYILFDSRVWTKDLSMCKSK